MPNEGKERLVLEAVAQLNAEGIDPAPIRHPEMAHGLDHKVALNAARHLLDKGLLSRPRAACYRLTAAGRRALAVPGATADPARPTSRAAPRQGVLPLPYERAWKAMRIKRRFTHPDLMMVISTDEHRVCPRNIRGYIAGLVAAGYVRCLYRPGRESVAGGSTARRYALVRDTGPKAPALRKPKGVLHDPNLGQDVPLDWMRTKVAA